MDTEKARLERKHQLEREVAEAILAVANGKAYLGIEGIANDTEALGTDYRFLADAIRSHRNEPPALEVTLRQLGSKLSRGTFA